MSETLRWNKAQALIFQVVTMEGRASKFGAILFEMYRAQGIHD